MRSLDADAQSIGKTKKSPPRAGQDAIEFDAEPAGYSQRKYSVDSGTLRFAGGGGTNRGTLAKMEAAGNLAVASWPREWDVRAGPDEPRSALAGAEVEAGRKNNA